MTTEEIRKCVEVKTWMVRSDGIIIEYSWKDRGKSFTEGRYLELNVNDATEELIAIGETSVTYWGRIMEFHILSQWDALNLVIRHELKKSAESDIENGDIGKAINKVLKSK